jgi:predicted hydrolase (HD superfamily)
MKTSISNQEAREIWDKYLKTEYLRLHTIESEAIMRKIANHLGEDEDFWGNTGLLHDLDMDVINGNYAEHGYKAVELLKAEGYDIPEMFNAIISHTEGVSGNEAKRTTDFELILSAAENITGIISAYVILTPEKKVAGTKVKSIKKRLKSKAFAASVNRDFIYDIEKAGIELDIFLQLAIDAMTEIADEIGM